MSRTMTLSDFALLGYQDQNAVVEKAAYTIFHAKAIAGLTTVSEKFIYIKSRCTNADVLEAARHVTGETTYVIAARTAEERLRFAQKELGERAKYFVYEDLIWERVKTLFARYLTALADGVQPPNPYVTPRPQGQPSEALDESLLRWLRDQAGAHKPLWVVRAPAGVGKTTLARQIVRRIADSAEKYRLIPIYVEAEHWSRISIDSLDDLWSMIDNSLRHFDEGVRITKPIFEHLLRCGDLTFVFDGFDELCGRRHSSFSPQEVIDELVRLTQEGSNARIVLTTRTAYWNSEVEETPECANIVDLAQFTKQQAIKYIEKKFANDRSLYDKAITLLNQVRAENIPPTAGGGKSQITYHPYVVALIASSAVEGVEALSKSGSRSELLNILFSFCEREQNRQRLETSAETQLGAFAEIAVELAVHGNNVFSAEDCAIAGIAEADLSRMGDHPLISVNGVKSDSRVFSFKYDFLPPLLIANSLCNAIVESSRNGVALNKHVVKLMEQEEQGKSHVLDHMRDVWGEEDIAHIGRCHAGLTDEHARAKSFLFHFAKLLVNERLRPATRRDRTDCMLQIFGNNPAERPTTVRGVYVSGSVEKFDLSGVVFEKCTFVDVTFSDCLADGSTAFRKCAFRGDFEIAGADRRTWSQVQLEDCVMPSVTRLVWEDVGGQAGKRTTDDVLDAIQIALAKFWYHGRLKKSIQKSHWKKGMMGRIAFGNDVLRAMLKVGLLYEIHISGVQEGGYAVVSGAIPDVQQFMDNRHVSGYVRRVLDELL